MRLTFAQERQLYNMCIERDVDLSYGKLSLCDLRHYRYSNVKDNRKYQVHCEDTQAPWSMIYDNLESAVYKFVELKNKIRSDK